MRRSFGIFIFVLGLSVSTHALAFEWSWFGPGSGVNYTGFVGGGRTFGFSWPWGFLSSPNQRQQRLPRLNNPPVWIPVPPQVGTAGTLLQFAVVAYDPEGEPLTYVATSLPMGAMFDATTHMFSWVPPAALIGSLSATFRASDGVKTADTSVSITVQEPRASGSPSWFGNYNQSWGTYVTPVNRLPVFAPIAPITIRAGQSVRFTVQAYDPEGDYLRYSNVIVPKGAQYDDRTHTFYWLPTPLQIGTYSVPFRVSDLRPDYVEMSVLITVTDQYGYLPSPTCIAGPGPYYFDFNPPTLVREGDLWSYWVIGSSGNINPVTYRLVDGPPGMSIDRDSGYMRWVPAFNMGGGTYPVRIAAYNTKCEAMKNFSVTVTEVR